ncbi:MAG: hypothetical protein COU25_02075 [Candidatus Levybacteria bacterium CG10_big_fil_rev_8_21_14_0_10_35_13]|nr:MAG: hypothetical protein COU25_02075 [Candidatus Levybacteria bacterium CG10_big_fil_rev_8_21_14_0_10_35_13]
MKITSALKKNEDGTLDITVTIPWSLIEKTKEEILEEHTKDASAPGFRKGKVPKKIVEQNLTADHLREDILRKILPVAYSEAIKEQKINPIISPRIHVEKPEDTKDWQFSAETCEMPKISLGNYKDEVKKITAKSKIAVPGKEPAQVSFEEITKALLQSTSLSIPKVVLDQEVEKLLSQTLDEIKKLGLTLDQYLASTKRTTESLRQEYLKKAEADTKLEFILSEIAKTENIQVEEKEIEEAIQAAKTETEKENLSQNRYLLASIIRQQKTLDFIRNL